LGNAKKILGIEIIQDRDSRLLYLSQQNYIEKVFERFRMDKSKPISTSLAAYFMLSSYLSLSIKEDVEHMSNMPYPSAIGSLM